METIKTYRVTITADYIIGVHATTQQAVIDWLDYTPIDIECFEDTGAESENFNTCLALYRS